jgi:hypothetical protein
MELDLIGTHDEGLFVMELKVQRSAERNAFSELFAYSNYIAGMFALSGHQDITNVLVANLDNKITKQAFLYDLLVSERDIIVYRPSFPTGSWRACSSTSTSRATKTSVTSPTRCCHTTLWLAR